MTLPAGNGASSPPLSFLQIQGEFAGVQPTSISQYYRGGPYVDISVSAGTGSFTTAPLTPTSPSQLPLAPAASGTNPIQLSQFYGTSNVISGNSGVIGPTFEATNATDYIDVTLPAGVNYIRFILIGAGGGGGGRNAVGGGDGGGGSVISGTINTSFAGTTAVARTLRFFPGRGGQGGVNQVNANSTANPASRGGSGYPMNGVQLPGTWGSFMNTYGVAWDHGVYESTLAAASSRMFYVPTAGLHQLQFTSDNSLYILIDGVAVADTAGNNDEPVSETSSYLRSTSNPLTKSNINLTAGFHKITCRNVNTGSVGGYGVRILGPSANQIWTTRDDVGNLGTGCGGNGGYPGTNGASGMGGGGGAATALFLVHPSSPSGLFHGMWPIAVAGGGGGGGGGGNTPETVNQTKNGNWMTQGWVTNTVYAYFAPGEEGDAINRPNNNQIGTLAFDGGGGGGGGGGVLNSRAYISNPSAQWPHSGFGGRTFRGIVTNGDTDADGGESGKSFVTAFATTYADLQHVVTTGRFPILSSWTGISGPTITALSGYGHGAAGALNSATAGTRADPGIAGCGFVDWGVTGPSVTTPSVSYPAIRAGVIPFEMYNQNFLGPVLPAGPRNVDVWNTSNSPTQFRLDAWGGGGRLNPNVEYNYSWSFVSNSGGSFSGATNTSTVFISTSGNGSNGVARCTVTDSFGNSAFQDINWTQSTYSDGGGGG